jgi:hypothetical protein
LVSSGSGAGSAFGIETSGQTESGKIILVADQNKSLSQKSKISLTGPNSNHRILPIWDFASLSQRQGSRSRATTFVALSHSTGL